jgi:hypothetical protein
MAERGVAADTPAAPKASLRGPLVHPAPAGLRGQASSSSSSTAHRISSPLAPMAPFPSQRL